MTDRIPDIAKYNGLPARKNGDSGTGKTAEPPTFLVNERIIFAPPGEPELKLRVAHVYEHGAILCLDEHGERNTISSGFVRYCRRDPEQSRPWRPTAPIAISGAGISLGKIDGGDLLGGNSTSIGPSRSHWTAPADSDPIADIKRAFEMDRQAAAAPRVPVLADGRYLLVPIGRFSHPGGEIEFTREDCAAIVESFSESVIIHKDFVSQEDFGRRLPAGVITALHVQWSPLGRMLYAVGTHRHLAPGVKDKGTRGRWELFTASLTKAPLAGWPELRKV